MAITTAIVSIAATAYSIDQQKDAEADAKRARREREKIRDAQSVRQRRNQIRDARIRRAQIIAQSENTGTTGSSSSIGAAGSIQSQLGSNLGFLDNINSLANRATIFDQNSEDHLSNARTAQAVGNVINSSNTTGLFKN